MCISGVETMVMRMEIFGPFQYVFSGLTKRLLKRGVMSGCSNVRSIIFS